MTNLTSWAKSKKTAGEWLGLRLEGELKFGQLAKPACLVFRLTVTKYCSDSLLVKDTAEYGGKSTSSHLNFPPKDAKINWKLLFSTLK